jgi:hypothetical protein
VIGPLGLQHSGSARAEDHRDTFRAVLLAQPYCLGQETVLMQAEPGEPIVAAVE